MRGLKTQEGEAFERFFEIVQKEAEKQDCVFFLFAGEGRDIILDGMEGEDLSGWLIPKDRANALEKDWMEDADMEHWAEWFIFAIWKEDEGTLSIEFKKFD